MKKIFSGALLIFITVLFGVVCGESQPQTSGSATTPISAEFPPRIASSVVSTPSILSEDVRAEILANPERESPYGDKVLESAEDYQIVYIAKDDLFLLSLRSLPLSEARAAAEQALLIRARNNLSAVCGLNTRVSAPRGVRCPEEENCVADVENPTSLNICSARSK